MASDTIQTKHPAGKSGRSISREKYDEVKDAMVAALRGRGLTHTELMSALQQKLKKSFDGNISWYGETVKLDLEARKTVQRTDEKPQRYRLRG
ncbi:MAG TPA: hypothetical protein VJX91_08515 [Candidatus Eisenbacteria bacterium]|nr:hypothetical protein [Candidatus Eisenbacteria bacterium]